MSGEPRIDLGQGVRPYSLLPLRTRPHRNPLAENDDSRPACPEAFRASLASKLPLAASRPIEIVDVGCAFGGMLFRMAAMFPDQLLLGLEIRGSVVAYATDKLKRLREAAAAEGPSAFRYDNLCFEQLNVMKFGSNCFERGQLSRLFFCYPDPHWKSRNVRRRIISPCLLHEYAFWLRVGGLLYTVTDVPQLGEWMAACLAQCPLFERLSEAELQAQPLLEQSVLQCAISSSEDGQRTARKSLTSHYGVYRRVQR